MTSPACVHVDAASGAAGDMLLGALIDAGVPVDGIAGVLDGLDLAGWGLAAERTTRAGQAACKALVTVPEPEPPRRFADIREVIARGRLPDAVRERSLSAFTRLARAEARLHDVDTDEVAFHELGAVDALVDIVGVCAGLHLLDAQRVTCGGVAQGSGAVETAHGRLPLPVPAVVELLVGAPTYSLPVDAELCTPTGAALLAEWVDEWTDLPPMTLRAVGYGAGTRELAFPNVIRLVVGEPHTRAAAASSGGGGATTSTSVVVETTVDDLAGELVPGVLDALLDAGADDAWAQQVLMKKGRPGLTITCLVPPERVDAARRVLVAETTTLGVRSHRVDKWALERGVATVEVAGHPVRVKVGRLDDAVVNAAPEHSDCATVAAVTGLSVQDVYARARAAWEHDRDPPGR